MWSVSLALLWMALVPSPALSVQIHPGHVCLPKGEGPVTFQATVQGADNAHYAWYVRRASERDWGDTPLVTGARAVSLEWANYTRLLKVVATAPDGRVAVDSVGIQYGGPNGAYCADYSGPVATPSEEPVEPGFYLGPNPTAGRLQLVLQVSLDDTVALSVYDALGRHVRSLSRVEGTADAPVVRTLDVSALAPGVYRVVARGQYATYSRSFTVAR